MYTKGTHDQKAEFKVPPDTCIWMVDDSHQRQILMLVIMCHFMSHDIKRGLYHCMAYSCTAHCLDNVLSVCRFYYGNIIFTLFREHIN